jgi:uncharacterized protein (TIGR02757 family)
LDRAAYLHVAPSKGLRFLLSTPSGGSGCKRLNMFMRWMVRQDQIDPGLWTCLGPASLIIPIDTHMNRICKLLGLHDGRAITIRAAIRLTERFARISPDDPVRYDWALSRVGIVDGCTGRPADRCARCGLADLCLA